MTITRTGNPRSRRIWALQSGKGRNSTRIKQRKRQRGGFFFGDLLGNVVKGIGSLFGAGINKNTPRRTRKRRRRGKNNTDYEYS